MEIESRFESWKLRVPKATRCARPIECERSLVKGAHRVGITAISYKVIGHLLGETCKVARGRCPSPSVQKANESDGCSDGIGEAAR
jgi:hypothetical protein